MAKDVKRLYRSNNEKIIAGVCGGIADHFEIDPIWVRLVFVLLTLLNGVGLILYLVLWILVPKNPNEKQTENTAAENIADKLQNKFKKNMDKKMEFREKEHNTTGIIAGLILVLIGFGFLFKFIFDWFKFNLVWPIIIIIIGLFLILGRRK